MKRVEEIPIQEYLLEVRKILSGDKALRGSWL
jgi:hypothetical protein